MRIMGQYTQSKPSLDAGYTQHCPKCGRQEKNITGLSEIYFPRIFCAGKNSELCLSHSQNWGRGRLCSTYLKEDNVAEEQDGISDEEFTI